MRDSELLLLTLALAAKRLSSIAAKLPPTAADEVTSVGETLLELRAALKGEAYAYPAPR